MVEILRQEYAAKQLRQGKTPKLCIEDMLPAELEYLREYRIYAHITTSFNIAESIKGGFALSQILDGAAARMEFRVYRIAFAANLTVCIQIGGVSG